MLTLTLKLIIIIIIINNYNKSLELKRKSLVLKRKSLVLKRKIPVLKGKSLVLKRKSLDLKRKILELKRKILELKSKCGLKEIFQVKNNTFLLKLIVKLQVCARATHKKIIRQFKYSITLLGLRVMQFKHLNKSDMFQ